ncbi:MULTISPECIES: ABC transporter substrate-binding protein [Xenorhabdus]|uniref:Iron complex transport system substrate-binding protein n=1 Tax=Xenorhabdus ehlersii TaxID=290111 RepID=A0A2D0IY88_9GAMM|nr:MULTISPECIES: ABC transporter substrate-binding protein [Xenorhabdus]MBC8947805.1 putative iron-siderophore uptake system exported solute-binding component [Xenorhabdus sp. TS4]MBC8948793.1 putative iron-siderophore uptake system exported solute-binding component [Xenorhabdus sp. TS4]PHM25309.1 putative iron-siderophore uptake system exported solute-binding component [Xenorhabdus ehlersii]PHM26886.1 putative iron-siderophore uptake system exported solute-binding component [Xenorhabdus ehlers
MRSAITVILLCLMGTSAFAATRQVTDTMGREVVIPEEPQRIVVMSEPAIGLPLMELGVQPVGSYGRSEDGTYQFGADFVDAVLGEGYTKPQGISAGREIDLEKLYALKPDLIIGTEFDIDKVKQLSTVAPVYLQNFLSGKFHHFNIEENLARLTGREQNFQERRDMYLQRVAETRELLPENPANKTYLPILVTDQINVVGEATGFTQALEDLGFTRLNLSAQGGLSAPSSQLLLQLSADKLGELNPDVLVVLNSWGSKEHDENAIRSALDRIVPGWAHYMKPASEKRIIFLNAGKVFTPTFASAEHTLRAVGEWAKTKQ